MAKTKIILMMLGCWLAAQAAWAQTNTNSFNFTIQPPQNSIMITETTNLVLVSVANMTMTNTTVVPDPNGGTNSVTNVVITPIFTNVVIRSTDGSGGTLSYLDRGQAPDKKANDGIFSANFIAPFVDYYTNLTFRFTLIGDDLSFTNDAGQQQITSITNTSTVTFKIVGRPQNDKFTNAFKIGPNGGLYIGTNNYASMETGEPQHAQVPTADVSVWWKWSTPFATNVLVDMAGSSFNPILAVYTGTLVTNLTVVASSTDDTALRLKAHVNFDAQPGVTYRIAVAGQDTNAVGNIRLRVVPGALPDTNGPIALISTPANSNLFTTNIVAFSGTAGESNANDSGVAKVYLKVNYLPAVLMTGASNWSGTLDLPPGTNQVQAYAVDFAGNTGVLKMIYVIFMNPTNDAFANAINLPGSSGTVTAINGRATKETGEPIHAGNEGGHSIWYKWKAPADGLLFLTTTNSNFDTLLAMYTGTNVTNLTVVASNDDAFDKSQFSQFTQFATSNQVYNIAVDGYGGASGNVRLRYGFTNRAPNIYYTLTINNTAGGSVTPATGYYPTNSTVTATAYPAKNFVFDSWTGSVSSTNNPITIAMTGDKTITARFRTINFAETFESGSLSNITWTTPSGKPWFVQTTNVSSGKWAARSGVVGDNEESTLQLVTRTLDGTGSFDVKVSSEPSWDVLEFYLNGKLIKTWSGEVGWQNYTFKVVAGTNTFLWRYVKDANYSEGLDAAFIDNLALPQGSMQATLSLSASPALGGVLDVQGKYDQVYIIQSSSNLVDWTSISTNRSVSGVIEFVDRPDPNQPVRFYRAITP